MVRLRDGEEGVSPEGMPTLVLGVIGADVHCFGNQVLEHALREAGFRTVNLGVWTSQEDFVRAAIETAADAVLVSSLYGHGEIDANVAVVQEAEIAQIAKWVAEFPVKSDQQDLDD